MKPQSVSQIDLAFPGDVSHLMPAYGDIPDEFTKDWNPWNKLAGDWFFKGVDTKNWSPKEGIQKDVALRHLTTIMRSFDPDHDHKIASVAYLISLWFNISELQ